VEQAKLGSSDLEISRIVLGAWAMGGGQWAGGADDEASIRTIRAALDLGINTIDTAEMYANGHADRVVGQALEGTKREDVRILTKVAPFHAKREQVIQVCDESLERLRTDYIDLFQIHWPPKTTAIAETMEAMKGLVSAGKVRCVGVSNFGVEQMEEAVGAGVVVSLQPPYNLLWRFIEEREVGFCLEHDISVIAYSPMMQGLLTGKFTKESRPGKGDVRAGNVVFQDEHFDRALAAVETLKGVGAKYGKTPAQTAIRWVLQRPAVAAAIVGARKPEQIAENVGAADWEIGAEDMAALETASRSVTDHLGHPDTLWGPLWY
jgi:aryl-alcohol dehydrogenase-like predicted oxidoreductase